MSAPDLLHDSHDGGGDDARAKALERHQRHQEFLKKEREAFRTQAREDFEGNLSTLQDIYCDALVDAVHFAPVHEIAAMVEVMCQLPVAGLSSAYGFGGYQEGVYRLPLHETEATTRDKIIRHVVACAPSSIILRGLADKPAPTVIPWQKAAEHPLFKAARLPDGSWDTARLKELAAARQAHHERVLQGLFHKNGPWLLWFHPDPGAWAANWNKCLVFVRSFNCLPDSIRFGFSPFLFSIVRVSVPARAAAAPVTAPPPPTTTVPPPQYPSDDQPL
jgi:hypothetical protein